MNHPRAVQNWKLVAQLLQLAVQTCKQMHVRWSQLSEESGGLEVVLRFEPHSPKKGALYEEFDRRLREGTPEMQDAAGRSSG